MSEKFRKSNDGTMMEKEEKTMGEKVYQFCEKLNKGKMGKRMLLFLYIILVILFCIFEVKNHCFYYPEKEYQVLEEEAQRLVQESGDSLEFETDYECIIDYYNNQSNELIFQLIDSEYRLYRSYDSDNQYIQPLPLYIKVKVEDWKVVDREIKGMERREKSKTNHIIIELLGIMLLPMIVSIIFAVIIEFCLLIYSIMYENKVAKRKLKTSLNNKIE